MCANESKWRAETNLGNGFTVVVDRELGSTEFTVLLYKGQRELNRSENISESAARAYCADLVAGPFLKGVTPTVTIKFPTG